VCGPRRRAARRRRRGAHGRRARPGPVAARPAAALQGQRRATAPAAPPIDLHTGGGLGGDTHRRRVAATPSRPRTPQPGCARSPRRRRRRRAAPGGFVPLASRSSAGKRPTLVSANVERDHRGLAADRLRGGGDHRQRAAVDDVFAPPPAPCAPAPGWRRRGCRSAPARRRHAPPGAGPDRWPARWRRLRASSDPAKLTAAIGGTSPWFHSEISSGRTPARTIDTARSSRPANAVASRRSASVLPDRAARTIVTRDPLPNGVSHSIALRVRSSGDRP